MNFGTVDALGINAGNCNKFAPTTPGTTNAIYWSDYNLNPVFTSQTNLQQHDHRSGDHGFRRAEQYLYRA